MLIYGTPSDGISTYGRSEGKPEHTETVKREIGIARFAEEWEQCRHLGSVPTRRKVAQVPVLVTLSQPVYPQEVVGPDLNS